MLPRRFSWFGLPLLCVLCIPTISTLEPITTLSAAVAAIAWYYDNSHCRVMECCDDRSISLSTSKLMQTFNQKLYGQHVVEKSVFWALQGHFYSPSDKALVLSFHGSPGVGKNHVSNIIRDSIYKAGARSKFYHFFSGGLDFPNPNKVQEYKWHLGNWIRGNLTDCGRSMFVFDEVDKMPPGVLDVIKPFIDHNDNVGKIDPRKAIFIFLSNTGSRFIWQKYLDLWKSSVKRQDITAEHFEELIKNGAYNEAGGLQNSETIKSNLIDLYVPFLPLEEKHVRQCIYAEIRKWAAHTTNVVEREIAELVLNDLPFYPRMEKIISTSGCKRIATKVLTHLSTHFKTRNNEHF